MTQNVGAENQKTTTTYTMVLTDAGKHGFDSELPESDIKRANISTATSTVAPTVAPAATIDGVTKTPMACSLS